MERFLHRIKFERADLESFNRPLKSINNDNKNEKCNFLQTIKIPYVFFAAVVFGVADMLVVYIARIVFSLYFTSLRWTGGHSIRVAHLCFQPLQSFTQKYFCSSRKSPDSHSPFLWHTRHKVSPCCEQLRLAHRELGYGTRVEY